MNLAELSAPARLVATSLTFNLEMISNEPGKDFVPSKRQRKRPGDPSWIPLCPHRCSSLCFHPRQGLLCHWDAARGWDPRRARAIWAGPLVHHRSVLSLMGLEAGGQWVQSHAEQVCP